jgi:hypothetical protein
MVTREGAGRALGQRIGNLQEDAYIRLLEPVVNSCGYRFSDRSTIKDVNGKTCIHDGLIEDLNNNPIIIFESKWIQKTKHATEKSSKAAREHPDIKRAHPTLRASIAVFAGAFTEAALKAARDAGSIVFWTPLDKVCRIFAKYGIEILWENSEAGHVAPQSLARFQKLTPEQKQDIGNQMISFHQEKLIETVKEILTTPPNPAIVEVRIDIIRQSGEYNHFRVESLEQAIDMLQTLREQGARS